MTDDPKKLDPRAVILARRAHFVAAAMASITMACGKQERPEVCLSVVTVPSDADPPDAGSAAVDAQAVVPESATTDASTPPPSPDAGHVEDAGTVTPPKRDAGAGGHAPHPCLRAPPPRPCLKVAPR